jgi:hypothetical protein
MDGRASLSQRRGHLGDTAVASVGADQVVALLGGLAGRLHPITGLVRDRDIPVDPGGAEHVVEHTQDRLGLAGRGIDDDLHAHR